MSDKTLDSASPSVQERKEIASLGFRVEKFRQASSLAWHLSRRGRLPVWIARYAEWGLNEDIKAALREQALYQTVQDGVFSPGSLVLQAGSLTLELEEKSSSDKVFWPWPAWWAMLRWRSLTSFWQRELRSNHYEALLAVAPSVWLLDFQPLPPGSVLPQWRLGQWPAQPENIPIGPGQKLTRISALGRETPQGEFLLKKWMPDQNGIFTQKVRPVYEVKDRLIKLKDLHPLL